MRTLVVFGMFIATMTAPLVVAPLGDASHATETFSASGHITFGNPAGGIIDTGLTTVGNFGVRERVWRQTGGNEVQGLDGWSIPLPAWAPGHLASLTGTDGSAGLLDLDANFYTSDRVFISYGDADADNTNCGTGAATETCLVPADAAFAFIDLFTGADADFTFSLSSVLVLAQCEDGLDNDGDNLTDFPADPGCDSSDDDSEAAAPGASFTIPSWISFGKAALDIVILPPAFGEIYDAEFNLLAGGTDVVWDDPYVEATTAAIQAWEDAMDAYVATRPSAAYLEAIEFDVRLVGQDASVADWVDADVRIAYGPTGAVILGVAFGFGATGDFNPDGSWAHCNILDFEWFLFSFKPADVFNIHAQEFGHCLGLNHPEEPTDDVMNGLYGFAPGDPANPRLCVSSLDVRGLEVVYAWLPTGNYTAPPAEITLPQSDYVLYPLAGTTSCPNAGSGA